MTTFQAIPHFGPQSISSDFQTIGLPISVGNLSAISTRNISRAEHVSIFIPGFTGSKEDFVDFLPTLQTVLPSSDRALLSYSQRGQADSSAPVGKAQYSMEAFVEDGCEVLDMLDAQDRPVDLVGHSFGGVVARRIALHAPHAIRSLTLLSSGAQRIHRTKEMVAAMLLLKLKGSSVIYRGAYPDLEDEPQEDPFVEMVRLRAHATATDNLLAIADMLGSYEDVTDTLAGLDLPIASIYGENDDVWPTEVFRDEAKRLHITPTVLRNAGHSIQIDQPRELAQLLSHFWLDNVKN